MTGWPGTRTAGIIGALAVAAGAFGAHALTGNPRIETWKTAALYHLVHAVALALPNTPIVARRLWLIGIVLFSGSLYSLVVLDAPRLGIITPFGGIALIAGWVCVALPRTA